MPQIRYWLWKGDTDPKKAINVGSKKINKFKVEGKIKNKKSNIKMKRYNRIETIRGNFEKTKDVCKFCKKKSWIVKKTNVIAYKEIKQEMSKQEK